MTKNTKTQKNAKDENVRFCTKSQKMKKTKTSVFVQNRKKKRNGNICVLCHNF